MEESRLKEVKALKDEIRALQVRIADKIFAILIYIIILIICV